MGWRFTIQALLLSVVIVKTICKHDIEDAIALLKNDDAKETNIVGHAVELPEGDIANIRIEFIKAQILKKLKMKETPQLEMALGELPVQLKLPHFEPTPAPPRSYRDDEPYATTSQVMLLANSEPSYCKQDLRASSCFSFVLPDDVTSADVNSTELWIYKLHDFMDNDLSAGQKIVYYEIIDGDEREIRSHYTEMADGWIKLNFSKDLKRWLNEKNYKPLLKVTCLTCGFYPPRSPIAIDEEIRPVLSINYEVNLKKKRPKRNINCMAGVTECCREKLFVNFKDIGWDDWVLEPRGYHAFFCKGSCSGATSATLANTLHNTILRKLSNHNKKLGPVPCCVANEHSAITLIYRQDNHTVTRTTLHNMVVESCGCM